MRFTFESVGGEGEIGNRSIAHGADSTVGPTSRGNIERIMDTLKQQSVDEANISSGDNGVTQIHTQMLNELQHQTRRKKMELRHRVTTLVNGCITVEEARLLVRDGSAGSGNISTGEVVFEMTLATISISL